MELSVELITRAQAAELLTVSEDTIDRLVKSGQLPAYKISPKIKKRQESRKLCDILPKRPIFCFD